VGYFTWDEVVDFGVRLLTCRGVPEQNARIVADAAVFTHAYGITTHGLPVFLNLDSTLGDDIDPKAEPTVVKEKGASALIAGNNAIGHLAVRLARDLAAEKAKAQGVGMVAVTNVSWIGAVGVHLLPLAEQGLLAEAWAQSCACRDCAPFGGIDATFSTNPIALVCPTDGDPMVSDFSTAALSMGKVGAMIQRGEKSDAPLFLDKDGNLSNDPRVVREGGSILFFGGEKFGYRGFGMSFWCEALTAVAGGNCNNPEKVQRQSFTITAIDPDGFAGRDYYRKEMARFLAHMRSSRVRPGFKAVRLPGARGHAALRAAREKGLAIEPPLLESLNNAAERNGVSKLAAGT